VSRPVVRSHARHERWFGAGTAIHSIDLMTREVIPAVKAYRPTWREKMKVAG